MRVDQLFGESKLSGMEWKEMQGSLVYYAAFSTHETEHEMRLKVQPKNTWADNWLASHPHQKPQAKKNGSIL